MDIKAWPRYARLVVRFEHPAAARAEGAADRHDPVDPETKADTMAWRLVQQIAWTLGLSIDREAGAEATTLAIEFPRTVSEELQGVSVVEVEHGFGASDNSKPLAGSHVLVVVSHRDVRAEVRESIRHMGLLVDFVNSVEEAEVFCRDALPHAILYESVLINERFQKLRSTILAEVPGFVFLQIDPEGQHLELSGSSSQHQARVGRQALMQSLPSALLFELARSA